VSVGVSFNKIFAKLGSDYKKPDAITTMYEDEFQRKAWCLPVSDLLYVGNATNKKLYSMGIRTIGDLAKSDETLLVRKLGKMGSILWAFANGYDESPVKLENYDIYVKQNSISAWELGTATPNARQFLALCEILEIYDIYTDFIGQSPLNPFRNLNENGMNKVLEYISDLESTGNYKPAEIIPIHVIRERKVFYNTVSAGTGSFLDGDEYEIFSSPDIPEAATFGVYVDGDSMEPKYHNKDLIWIEQTACLDNGEIGIFYLDGNAYVKKFQNNRLGTYLISLNKKYDPIPVTESAIKINSDCLEIQLFLIVHSAHLL
jgi:SOS-response transcriptional repressor LexA